MESQGTSERTKQPNASPKAPSQTRGRVLGRALGTFPLPVSPLFTSTCHRRDNKILIYLIWGHPGSIMSHDTLMTTIQATQPGCEGGTPLLAQIQKVLMLQEGTGSGAQKLSMGPHECTRAPWELALSVQDRKASTTFHLVPHHRCSKRMVSLQK